MKKEHKNAGKGMRPTIGYNPKNWYKNWSKINWHNKWCNYCGYWTNHTSGLCKRLRKDIK